MPPDAARHVRVWRQRRPLHQRVPRLFQGAAEAEQGQAGEARHAHGRTCAAQAAPVSTRAPRITGRGQPHSVQLARISRLEQASGRRQSAMGRHVSQPGRTTATTMDRACPAPVLPDRTFAGWRRAWRQTSGWARPWATPTTGPLRRPGVSLGEENIAPGQRSCASPLNLGGESPPRHFNALLILAASRGRRPVPSMQDARTYTQSPTSFPVSSPHSMRAQDLHL